MRDDRHPNFVRRHGETVWIPPKEHVEWFRDPEPGPGERDAEVYGEALPPEAPSEGRERSPAYIMPGAERARIALEEGARAEYWMTAHEHPRSAWACLVLYAAGLGMLLVILVLQGISVWRSAGF